MKLSNKQLLGLALLGGAAAWYFMNQQPRYVGPYSNIPPPPPQNSPNFQVWVNTILSTFGQVTDLWKPGGPFYKQPVPMLPTGGGSPLPNNPAAPGGIYGLGSTAPLLFLLPGV